MTRELTSWKEIAEFLGVSVRAAQNWERDRGLRVHRLPGDRGRVFAYTDELTAWKLSLAEPQPAPPPGQDARRKRITTLSGVGIALLIVVSVLAGWAAVWRTAPPAACRFADGALIALDARGHETWRHHFGSHPVHPAYELPAFGGMPRPWLGDLDGDGQTELLFAYRPAGNLGGRSALMCFSQEGRILWSFVAGKPVATRKEAFRQPFELHAFAVLPRPKGGLGIVTSAVASGYYPNVISLLSPDGKVEREYWHSGALPALAIEDLDGDGANEIYAAGVNNDWNMAELVILDPKTMGGASIEPNPDYQLLGFPPGREIARILFTRTCINRAAERRNAAFAVEVYGGQLKVHVRERELVPGNTIFDFDRSLRLLRAEFNDPLKALHNELRTQGHLDHDYSSREDQELARGVLVFTSANLPRPRL